MSEQDIEISELRKQFQQRQLMLQAAIARNDNKAAEQHMVEASALQEKISQLVLKKMYGGMQ